MMRLRMAFFSMASTMLMVTMKTVCFRWQRPIIMSLSKRTLSCIHSIPIYFTNTIIIFESGKIVNELALSLGFRKPLSLGFRKTFSLCFRKAFSLVSEKPPVRLFATPIPSLPLSVSSVEEKQRIYVVRKGWRYINTRS